MNFYQKKHNDQYTIAIEGRIHDSKDAVELEHVLRTKLDGIRVLVLDCAKLDFISSDGLRIFLIAQRIMNRQGKMVVLNVSETVMEVMEVTGFANVLTIL